MSAPDYLVVPGVTAALAHVGLSLIPTLSEDLALQNFFTGQLARAVASWAAITETCGQQLELARSLM